jgi:cytochrome c biogenesis protein CcmG/thiol:disulfide interchange protein DsbE
MEEQIKMSIKAQRGRRWGAIVAWTAVMGLLLLVGFGLLRANRDPLQVGQPAPGFVLTTFEGAEINIADLRGQVVVVNVWASWCVTCVDEAELLERAYQMFKDRGVVFLGVDWSDTESKALAYLERYGITYPNGPDLGQQVKKDYRVTKVPETFLIGPDGNIAGIKIGAFYSFDEIVAMVEAAGAK